MTLTDGSRADIDRRLPPEDLITVLADSRLIWAWNRVQAPDIQLLSLDIFDTLLWRTVAEPVDAFLLLGQRLLDGHVTTLRPPAFARLRQHAESRARAHSWSTRGTRECTLEEIYDQLAAVLPQDRAACPQLEVDVERELCRPDLAVAALVRLAGAMGKSVQLVSDTYFSEPQLRQLLAHPELAPLTKVPVWSSSEHGVSKAEGLLARAAEAAGVQPGQVVHAGDNRTADVAAAEALGMSAVDYSGFTPALERAVARERRVLSIVGAARSPDGTDSGLLALRSRAAHRAEVLSLPARLAPFWTAGATIFGPALTGFSSWVHERARAVGASKVFCLMREGQFLSELIVTAGISAPQPVVAQTLWLSRQVCALASIESAGEAELHEFLTRRKPGTVEGLLRQLSVDPSLVPELATLLPVPLSTKVLPQVESALADSPGAQRAISARAAQLRERLLTHLDAQLPAEGPIVLVDVGWGGTMQSLLSELLRARGTPRQVVGLYLVTHGVAERRALDGLVTEGFLHEGGDRGGLVGALLRTPEILEQVCIADEGSLIDIARDGGLVHAEARMPRSQVAEKVAVQQGVRAFQDLWAVNRSSGRTLLRLDAPSTRLEMLACLSSMVSTPTTEEATAFGGWKHDENFGSDDVDLLVDDDTVLRVAYLSPPAVAHLSMRDSYWPAGAAALTTPSSVERVGLALHGVLGGEEISELGHVDVFVDDGLPFRPELMARVTPRVGPQGRCLAVAFLEVEELARVRVDPYGSHGIWRIDWLRIEVARLDGSRSSVLLNDLEVAGVQMLGGRWLQPGVLEILHEDPQIIIDVPRVLGAQAMLSGVQVELAYAGLALPPGEVDVLRDAQRQPPPQGAMEPPVPRADPRAAPTALLTRGLSLARRLRA